MFTTSVTGFIYPKSSPEFSVRQFGSKSQVFQRNLLLGSFVPGEKDSHLEGGHIQVKFTHSIGKLNLIEKEKIFNNGQLD